MLGINTVKQRLFLDQFLEGIHSLCQCNLDVEYLAEAVTRDQAVEAAGYWLDGDQCERKGDDV